MAGAPSFIELPDGAPGIGFDDLRFAPALGKLLVPAGRSGKLDLLDPATRAIQPIAGFSVEPTFTRGHDFGVTSADVAGKWLLATDRSSRKLALVDLAAGALVASAPLAAGPDYVRHVAPTGEVWVTEPDADQIEIFSVPVTAGAPVLELELNGTVRQLAESIVFRRWWPRARTMRATGRWWYRTSASPRAAPSSPPPTRSSCATGASLPGSS